MPPLSAGGGGGFDPPTKFSTLGGGLTGRHILEGDCWERRGDLFQGGEGEGGGGEFVNKK